MIDSSNYTKWEWVSKSPAETDEFGRFLAERLRANDVICLDGDLGAGKTALTKGIAAGIGLVDTVTSPTFTILSEYPAGIKGLPFYHFDVYRLTDSNDFYANGFDEYFNIDGLSVIEWGKIVIEALPDRTLFINLFQTSYDQPEQRKIMLEWPHCPERLDKLKKDWKKHRRN